MMSAFRTVAASGFWMLATTVVHAQTPAHRAEPLPAAAERASEIRLPGEGLTLPLVMIGEFPFIEASINGVRGKLMLDTGIEAALTLNDHRVPTVGAQLAGRRFSGSGQTFEATVVPEVQDIRIGSLRFPRGTSVDAQDARLLENITPDFVGWLGYRAFADAVMRLDYKRSRVTFYAPGELRSINRDGVVARLRFETRKLPNHPVMNGSIGTMPIVTTWDTGQNGVLHVSPGAKVRLLREGSLRPSRTTHGAFDLHRLRLGGRTMPPLRAIEVEALPSRAAALIGIVEPAHLSIGYSLLRQFTSIWDYREKTIHLLSD